MVNNKTLVTYATRTGSTAGVAEAIAKTLREYGVQVDTIPMQKVTDLTSYQAVVAGSAIQNRQWLPEAVEFVRAHQPILNQKLFAMFAVCMALAMKNGESMRPQISEWLAPCAEWCGPSVRMSLQVFWISAKSHRSVTD